MIVQRGQITFTIYFGLDLIFVSKNTIFKKKFLQPVNSLQ